MKFKKQLNDNEVEMGWILNNELKLAIGEREILLTARQELLKERKSIRDRISALDLFSKWGRGSSTHG